MDTADPTDDPDNDAEPAAQQKGEWQPASALPGAADQCSAAAAALAMDVDPDRMLHSFEIDSAQVHGCFQTCLCCIAADKLLLHLSSSLSHFMTQKSFCGVGPKVLPLYRQPVWTSTYGIGWHNLHLCMSQFRLAILVCVLHDGRNKLMHVQDQKQPA